MFCGEIFGTKRTAMIYTMNMPKELHDEYKYNDLFKKYEDLMMRFFNDCTTLFASQTLFVKNYDKYHLELYDENDIMQRHEEVFSKNLSKSL